MKQIFNFFILTVLLSACASEPFRPGYSVGVEGPFYNRKYIQAGHEVSIDEMMRQLREYKESKEPALYGQILYYGALASAFTGGFLVGYGAVSDSDSKSTMLLAGVGLIGVSAVAAYFGDQQLMQAVDAYNQKLGIKKTSQVMVRPSLGLARNHPSGGLTPVLGVSVSF